MSGYNELIAVACEGEIEELVTEAKGARDFTDAELGRSWQKQIITEDSAPMTMRYTLRAVWRFWQITYEMSLRNPVKSEKKKNEPSSSDE